MASRRRSVAPADACAANPARELRRLAAERPSLSRAKRPFRYGHSAASTPAGSSPHHPIAALARKALNAGTTMTHSFKFVRAGGFDQVQITTGADLKALPELDQKLWVALACPTTGIEFDARTLELLDARQGQAHPRARAARRGEVGLRPTWTPTSWWRARATLELVLHQREGTTRASSCSRPRRPSSRPSAKDAAALSAWRTPARRAPRSTRTRSTATACMVEAAVEDEALKATFPTCSRAPRRRTRTRAARRAHRGH
jgi:hypothetical protein